MKKRHILSLLFASLAAQCAFATSQCQPYAKRCGPNPFYVLVLGFTQACSAKYPENAAQYEAKLEKLVAENPQVYKKLNSDAEFVAKLNEVKQGINSMTPDELRIECSRLRDE
jgi:hypothetical protein